MSSFWNMKEFQLQVPLRCFIFPSAIFDLLSGIESDIIDEAIYYFKANVFFKNYEIKVTVLHLQGRGPSDAR